MGNCKDCRWWQIKDDSDEDMVSPYDPDTYEPMQGVPEFRHCTSPKLLFHERPVESDWATVVDGSGYRAVLITGADFGCVNFEEKSEA